MAGGVYGREMERWSERGWWGGIDDLMRFPVAEKNFADFFVGAETKKGRVPKSADRIRWNPPRHAGTLPKCKKFAGSSGGDGDK